MKPETVIVQINIPTYWDDAQTEREVIELFDTHPDTAIELRFVDVERPIRASNTTTSDASLGETDNED